MEKLYESLDNFWKGKTECTIQYRSGMGIKTFIGFIGRFNSKIVVLATEKQLKNFDCIDHQELTEVPVSNIINILESVTVCP